MNVPLSVTPEEKHQKEKLNIWKNGKKIIKDAPIYPYFYTDKEFNIPSAINVSTIEKIALSDFQYRTFYKYEFLTRDDLVQARNRLNHNKIDIAFEANIPFIIRNRIDNPDIYTEYPHTDPIKFHFLDIEQDTPPDKMFPTPDDIITSVTFAGSDKKLRSIYVSKFENGDYKLLETYMNIYTKDKPDIIVLYNKSYDMPVILGRCKRHKISTKLFSKSTAEPFVGGKHGVNIDGTIVYDIYDSSKADQSLTGNVPSRTLKYVSDYFGFKTDIEVIDFETVDSRTLIGTKKLVSYNQDDVRRLLHLFNIYWDEIEYKANDLKIPMNEAVDLGVSDLALVVLGDLYREHDIIADGSNYTRFPEIFQREKENDEKNYQGALSEIYQKGLFIPVHKADYGCADEETEILTEKGWKKYNELKLKDYIYTWNPDKNIFEKEQPLKINIFDYDGPLIHTLSKHISFAVTPNHRVYYYGCRGKKKGQLFVDRADSLPTYIDVPINSVFEGKVSKYSPYVKLFAWIITEASISSYPRITISQRKCVSLSNSISHVRKILEDANIPFKEKKRKNRDDVEFYIDTDTSRFLLSIMGNNGKSIPTFIYQLPVKERLSFIKELVYGDGTFYRNTAVLTTSSKEFVDEVQHLCTITGLRTTVNFSRNEYFIHILDKNLTGLRLNQLRPNKKELYKEETYKGKVWCPTTKNGTWVCRRKGKIHITGNSMYPNILSEFNFSPDTCTLLRYDDYDKDAFRFEELEDTIIYHIPDNQIHKTVVLECKKEKGFLSVAVKRFLDERSTFKKKWKETGKKKYRSRSDISKVKANGGIYGVMGASHHPFGFVPAAIGTTGIGRICAQLLIDVLEDLYPGSVIEVDTDGVYFTATDIDEDLIIKKFNEALFKTFNRALNLTIDIDSYDKGYFHKAKNYILKKGDNIILHGASMKSSKMCPMERKFIKEIAEAKLANEPTDPIVSHYLEDMETFPLRDFAMQVSLGKHIHQYKNQNSIGVRMALAAKYHYQIEPELGNEYFYVKITTGYELYQICKKERLDINYYKKKIRDITKRLDIELKETEHIEDFL